MKQIFSTFKGLGDSDRNLAEGYYYAGLDIDLYRDYGYAMPGFSKTDITITGINQGIQDIVHDGSNSRCYLFGSNGRVYGVSTIDDTDLGNTFGGGSQNYVAVTGMSESKGIIMYSGADSGNRLFFAFVRQTGGDIGKGVLGTISATDFSGTDIDWGSSVPTGKKSLNGGRKDMIEWNSYLWITNDRYIAKVDTITATPVLTAEAFDLGYGWTADRLFTTSNYIGIFASKNTSLAVPSEVRAVNESRLYLWDGASTLPYKIIPLKGVNQVHACINRNGTIFVFYDNRSAAHCVGVLQEDGLEKIQSLKHDVSGTLNTFLSPGSNNTVSIYKNNVLFGSRGSSGATGKGEIFSYGRNSINDNFTLSMPYSCSLSASSAVYSLAQIDNDKLYAGYYDGTNNKLCKFTTGNSTNASLKWGYTDLGQKAVLNYIEVFFKPLVASDSITVRMDTDYGTSNTIQESSGVISHTKYGVITYKKFDLGGIECHAFRPTISWSAGGVEISKVVVDYSFINN